MSGRKYIPIIITIIITIIIIITINEETTPRKSKNYPGGNKTGKSEADRNV